MRVISRIRVGVALAAALAVVAAGCGSDDKTTSESSSTTAPDRIIIGAGINDPDDPTVAVLQFMPAKVTVEAGTTVTWEWSGAEPHSVTFLEPGTEVPNPEEDQSLFAPTPPTGPYDGVSLVNSGLQPLGPTAPAPFEMAFEKPGAFPFHCVIHPQMVGEVTVVAAGASADAPGDVAKRRADDAAKWLKEGQQAKAKLVAETPTSTKNADGSTTWTVHMGASTAHTDVLAFAPSPATVKAGDTVMFVNSSSAPHTASFFGTGAELIQDPTDPRVGPPAPGPSPQSLSSSGFFNTGLLPPDAPPGAGPPLAVRSFSFKVPDAGSYSYVCLLHAPSKMIGTITAA